MSQLDALIERSRAPGTFVEKRTFTLARSKAIEKMREFTLRHPRQYVLELVQAAVFAGARWIAVDVANDHLVVAWVGGRTLAQRELETLFDYLFADQGNADDRHLLQAAVGINAILQRKPRRVRIESGDGTVRGTARLDLDRRGEGVLGVPETPLAGTYLYAEFSTSFFSRFAAIESVPAETQLVETRCLYTPTPILLNGNAPFGYRSSKKVQLFGVRRAVQIDAAGRRGALGLPEAGVKPGVRIVVGGVWITDRPFDELGPDLVGVVADDRLRKTADMSDIVEDARWIDLLHEVQPAAVKLIRSTKGPSWMPPRLPARVTEEPVARASDEPPLEPLPEWFEQIEPRPPIDLPEVQAMGEIEPLFWAEQDVAAGLTAACDPARFPYRVLILSPGQARTLANSMPNGPSPSRLTTPEDVGFVRAAMERRHGMHVVQLDEALDVGLGAPVHVRVSLRLHLDGPEPLWHRRKGGVPIAVVRQGRTQRLGRLQLPLHHVSVVAEVLSKGVRTDDPGLWPAVRDLVQRNAWRLLPDLASLGSDERRRKLELALLADHARSHLLRDEAGHLSVTAHLPSAWRSVADALLDAPLADTTDGALTLRRLIGLQVADETVQLRNPADRALVEPLERRFGLGRVVVADDLTAPLAIVGRVGQAWRGLGRGELASPMVSQVVLVFPCLRTPEAPPGWTALPSPGGGIAHWHRGLDGDAPVPLSQAAPTMLRVLRELETHDWQPRPAPKVISQARADAMGRLAAIQVAAASGMLSEVRITDTNQRSYPISEALTDPTLCCAASGGATTRGRHVFPITLDEARALDQARRRQGLGLLPLLLDDHPDVWVAIDDHDVDHWLVRLPVDQPGLRGWLGLRRPWDPTPGVLLETAEHLEVLPGLTARIPCHGLLHLTKDGGLTDAQLELLHFAGVQLYQSLIPHLTADGDDADLDVARRYATAFTVAAWRRSSGRLPRGLARQLASLVPVDDAEGNPWGTLRDWLGAPPDGRPEPPPGVPPAAAAPHREPRAIAMDDDTWSCLSEPLQRALAVQRPGVRVRVLEAPVDQALSVNAARSTPGMCVLDLQRTPLAERALNGDEMARGLLLVEGVRRLDEWALAIGASLDPYALQQTVLAGRLARA